MKREAYERHIIGEIEELGDESIEQWDGPSHVVSRDALVAAAPLIPKPLLYTMLGAPVLSWVVGLLVGALIG